MVLDIDCLSPLLLVSLIYNDCLVSCLYDCFAFTYLFCMLITLLGLVSWTPYFAGNLWCLLVVVG